MLKDQEKIRKIAHECAKAYSALKNSGVSSGLQTPPRSWIRAWMQANYNIIKLSGYFYKIFNEEIWHNDLNESFTSNVIKNVDKSKEELKKKFFDLKEVLSRKIKETLEEGRYENRPCHDANYPSGKMTYTYKSSTVGDSEKELRPITTYSYKIYLGEENYGGMGTNVYFLNIYINSAIEYDDEEDSNTFEMRFKWYAKDNHTISSTTDHLYIPINLFKEYKYNAISAGVYEYRITKNSIEEVIRILKTIINNRAKIEHVFGTAPIYDKNHVHNILRLCGMIKKEKIDESFTSKIIDKAKETTQDQKRNELFGIPIETIEGETVCIKPSEDRRKNNLFKLLIKNAKVKLWSSYKRTDVHEHSVDNYIYIDEDNSYCVGLYNGTSAFASKGTPLELTYMSEYLNGQGGVLKLGSYSMPYETTTYTLSVVNGEGRGEWSLEILRFKMTRKGWEASMQLYYRDLSNIGPRSRNGKWTTKKAHVSKKTVPWLDELY